MSATFHAKNGHNQGFKWRTFESFQGLRPSGPPAGALPLHPARGPKVGPWTPPTLSFAHTESGKINFLAPLPSPQ